MHDWRSTPIVTTISFKKLNQEVFPAISLCFDHLEWQWPGIINLATQWKLGLSKPTEESLNVFLGLYTRLTGGAL